MSRTRDIDQIIHRIRAEVPDAHVSQLSVLHPGADDDGLWFIGLAGRTQVIQIESSTGDCPFLVESDFNIERLRGHSVEEVVAAVRGLLEDDRANIR